MEDLKIDIWSMFWRRLFAMIRTKVTIVLILIGITLFNIAVSIFDPYQKPTFDVAQAQQEEVANALREGRAPDIMQFVPYDNSSVINYLVPLFGIWLLCRFARRRRRLPVAIIGTLVLLWAGLWLTWTGGEALADLYDAQWMSDKNRGQTWIFTGIMAILVPVLSFRWLWRGPGWLDRILRGGGGNDDDESAAWARFWLFATVIAGAPALWWMYDGFDGGSIPGPFALGARTSFVVWALWLMTSAQFNLVWPGDGPNIEETPEEAIEAFFDT
ncbi:MAG: hypothetical protein OEZ03_13860 [Alphaproteobacteria bacterium]|nr:hypothetical protein [Alphaproteobacteria bacterium]